MGGAAVIVWCRKCESEPLVVRFQPWPFTLCDSCCVYEYGSYSQRYVLGSYTAAERFAVQTKRGLFTVSAEALEDRINPVDKLHRTISDINQALDVLSWGDLFSYGPNEDHIIRSEN